MRNKVMVNSKAALGLTTLAALGLAAARPQAACAQVTIANPSFESSPLGHYQPITGWTTAINNSNGGGYGTDVSGGAFNGGSTIPDGANVAFLQAVDNSVTMSQLLSGFTSGDRYVVTFYDNARAGYLDPTLIATLGGVTIVPATDVRPLGGSSAYNFVTAAAYTATGSTATLAFVNASPTTYDTTLLIDKVSIQDIGPAAAPEPSQTAALGLGVLGLAGLALRARKRRVTTA